MDGDHYRLAFDQPGTWSQKYNLVWDKCSGLTLPARVAQKEIAFYKTKHEHVRAAAGQPQGVHEAGLDALDGHAGGIREADFETFVGPAYRFANETPDRVPLSDWYWTTDGSSRAFQGAVGGGRGFY